MGELGPLSGTQLSTGLLLIERLTGLLEAVRLSEASRGLAHPTQHSQHAQQLRTEIHGGTEYRDSLDTPSAMLEVCD